MKIKNKITSIIITILGALFIVPIFIIIYAYTVIQVYSYRGFNNENQK